MNIKSIFIPDTFSLFSVKCGNTHVLLMTIEQINNIDYCGFNNYEEQSIIWACISACIGGGCLLLSFVITYFMIWF